MGSSPGASHSGTGLYGRLNQKRRPWDRQREGREVFFFFLLLVFHLHAFPIFLQAFSVNEPHLPWLSHHLPSP